MDLVVSIIKQIKNLVKPDHKFVLAGKGIEKKSSCLLSEIIEEELGTSKNVAILSGPTFALEVAQKLKALGVEESLIGLKCMNQGMLVILGKKNIMDSISDTFISSTFWTERAGPAAALKTLEIMEKRKSWNSFFNSRPII